MLNCGCLIAESEQDFPLHFWAYLPWCEGQQVTFNEHFLDRGLRVKFAMRKHDRDWLQQFEAHALIELEVRPDGKYKLPDLNTTPAPFLAWPATGESWDTLVMQVI